METGDCWAMISFGIFCLILFTIFVIGINKSKPKNLNSSKEIVDEKNQMDKI